MDPELGDLDDRRFTLVALQGRQEQRRLRRRRIDVHRGHSMQGVLPDFAQ